MNIGNVQLKNNVVLAPMAGVTDLPYRLICIEEGVGLVYTELISAKGLYYENDKTNDMLITDSREKPSTIQIFGSDAKIMGAIAKKLNAIDFDILDINMGCPAPKIVKNGDGSALMRDPENVGAIITEVVKNSEKPVTFKIRKGWDDTSINAVEIAKIGEQCGAAAVAVHGRTRDQFYSGVADYNIIRDVKKAVSIPVIGNGDIVDYKSAKYMLDYTGCDGIMIGRGAQGNPFIFREITTFLQTGEVLPKPTKEEILNMALRHTRDLIEYKGEYTGIREARKHLGWYIKGLQNSTVARTKLNTAQNYAEIQRIIEETLINF